MEVTMFNDIKDEYDKFEQDMRNKVYQIKYSSEYLDLKDNLNSAGSKAKDIYNNELKSASRNLSSIVKSVFTKKTLKKLIPIRT